MKKETFARTFTEPGVIQPIFISGVAQADMLEGELVCLSGYLDLPPVETEGGVPGAHELRITEKIILPYTAIPALQALLTQLMTLGAVQRARVLPIGH